MLHGKDKKFKQNSPKKSASLLEQVHSEIAKSMSSSSSSSPAAPTTTTNTTTNTASKEQRTVKEQGTFDIPIEIDDDDDVILLEEDSSTTTSSSSSSRPGKKDPPGTLYTMAFDNSEPSLQQETPPPSPPPSLPPKATGTTRTSTREIHKSKQQQHSEASEKTSSSAATCVVGSAEIPIDIDDDDDDEIEVLEAESTQLLGRMVREMLSSKTSSNTSKKKRYKSTHGKEFSNKKARPSSPERRFVFQTTASRRPLPPPTIHLNPNTWNYKWTCLDAMKEQERMINASAARMRSQTNVRVLPSTTTATTTTTFDAVMPNIHETHPHHWQLQDPYARLGLPVGSSPKVIKQQYRRLALVYHPDKSRVEHTATKFQQVTEAYRSILNT
jgi:hypothetical protein